MALNGTIGFLGFGNMGSAILEGLIRLKICMPENVVIYDPDDGRRAAARQLRVRIAEDAPELAKSCDILVLAVKPQAMNIALAALSVPPGKKPLFISVAAGISIAWLCERLEEDARIIRVMPNTPALVEAGAAGIAPGPGCTQEDIAAARAIFEAVGIAEIVEEKDIDAVTALSGSGPAYFFYLTECLVKAAVAEGLNEDTAARLAAQTLLGAGKLLTESGEPAAALREKVTSKGGTTEAALCAFASRDFEGVVSAGVAAAAARSRKLGG
jgi:pyrroline-5-carboxylate reductase